jgi:tryptophan-rich sensory protein
MNAIGTKFAVKSLGGNLAAFLLPSLLLNGLIFGLGWDGNSAPDPYLPPGWAVGTIWMLLFTAMGVARWMLVRNVPANSGSHDRPIVWLAFLCLIYPLYTGGLRSETVGLAGSMSTAILALWVTVQIAKPSRAAAALTGLVVAWLAYASVALALSMHSQGIL